MSSGRYRPTKQDGVALIAALFLLIVLTAMGIYLVSISAVQHQTSTLAIDSAKATYAAESGVEVAAYRALQSGTCAAALIQVDRFDVTLTCEASTHTERGRTITVYRLEARAEAGTYGNLGYASRTIKATVSDAP